MNRRKLFRWFCALLLVAWLTIAVTKVRAQDPGDCGPIQENGECKKQNGTACKTKDGKAGLCKSAVAYSEKFTCQCVPNEEKKKDGGGTYTSLIVFLALLTSWLGFRGARWLRQ